MHSSESLLCDAQSLLLKEAKGQLRHVESATRRRRLTAPALDASQPQPLLISLDRAALAAVVAAAEARTREVQLLTQQLQALWGTLRDTAALPDGVAGCFSAARATRLAAQLAALEAAHAAGVEEQAEVVQQYQRDRHSLQAAFQQRCASYGAVQDAVLSAARECASLQRRLRGALAGEGQEAEGEAASGTAVLCAVLTRRLWCAYEQYMAMYPGACLSKLLGQDASPTVRTASGGGGAAQSHDNTTARGVTVREALQALQVRAGCLLKRLDAAQGEPAAAARYESPSPSHPAPLAAHPTAAPSHRRSSACAVVMGVRGARTRPGTPPCHAQLDSGDAEPSRSDAVRGDAPQAYRDTAAAQLHVAADAPRPRATAGQSEATQTDEGDAAALTAAPTAAALKLSSDVEAWRARLQGVQNRLSASLSAAARSHDHDGLQRDWGRRAVRGATPLGGSRPSVTRPPTSAAREASASPTRAPPTPAAQLCPQPCEVGAEPRLFASLSSRAEPPLLGDSPSGTPAHVLPGRDWSAEQRTAARASPVGVRPAAEARRRAMATQHDVQLRTLQCMRQQIGSAIASLVDFSTLNGSSELA